MTEHDIQRSLGRIEARLEAILGRLDTMDENNKDRDNRLSTLERWRAWQSGIAATLGAIFAWVLKK